MSGLVDWTSTKFIFYWLVVRALALKMSIIAEVYQNAEQNPHRMTMICFLTAIAYLDVDLIKDAIVSHLSSFRN